MLSDPELTQRKPKINNNAAIPTSTPATIPTIPPVDILFHIHPKYEDHLRNQPSCRYIDMGTATAVQTHPEDPSSSLAPSFPSPAPAIPTAELAGAELTATALLLTLLLVVILLLVARGLEELLLLLPLVPRVEPIRREGTERVSVMTSLVELVDAGTGVVEVGLGCTWVVGGGAGVELVVRAGRCVVGSGELDEAYHVKSNPTIRPSASRLENVYRGKGMEDRPERDRNC